MLGQIIKEYNEALYDTDRDLALQVVHDAVKAGVTPEEIVFQVVLPAMDMMIQALSEDHGATLAQYFLTAQIADMVTAEMVARFQTAPESVGRVVIGTAYGDLHTLGKRIVTGCLKARMIEVIDLGVNVPAERFVNEAVAHEATVIAISAMMMHTARGENGCLGVRRLLDQRGLSGRIKIIVGGAPFHFDQELYRTVQADAWADNGISAGKVIADLIREVSP